MGNDVSSSSPARTHIPLDDAVCWQMYNGVNQRSEPISIFIPKQSFSVECRRSIQFLKTIRHPNIVKFLLDFKTHFEHDSFIADCVHPLSDSSALDSPIKLCLGLHQLTQALQFLHEKTAISHNNICPSSLFVSLGGSWVLGNFECACRYENLNRKYLSSLKLIRAEDCITPEEQKETTEEFNSQQLYALDVYALGTLIRNLMKIVTIDGSLQSLLNDLQVSLTVEDPQARPTWPVLLKTQLFQIDYIKVTDLLTRLPTVDESDLPAVVDALATSLDALDGENFNELLVRRLFVPFIFLCSTTRTILVPRILTPKDEQTNNAWIPLENYRTFAIPLIVDLFAYHVVCIRQTLLEYFHTYWQLIDRTILTGIVLPQLAYGLKDTNDSICMLTLIALASMIPVLGADIVLGGKRRQIFNDKVKLEKIEFSKTFKPITRTNSAVSTPPSTRATSPKAPVENKPRRAKTTPPVIKKVPPPSLPLPPAPAPAPLLLSNGHHSTSSLPVQNGLSEHVVDDDNDDDKSQWSDWENEPEPSASPIDHSPPPAEPFTINPIVPPSRPIPTTTARTRPRWDPNAPLGSEYEMPPVMLANKKTTKMEATSIQDSDDLFADMAPKVQTVELMRQLETMFNLDTSEKKPANPASTTAAKATFASKFGMISDGLGDNQETDHGDNWDE